MKVELTEKVALVTGSAHRVGKSIALALAHEGVNIVVHYNSSDPTTVRDTVHDIKTLGVDAQPLQCDLSDPHEIPKLIEQIKDTFGRLDILVNSASVFPSGKLMNVTVEDWNLTMNVNLRAPFLLTQHAASLMYQNLQPGGAIVNICDLGAFTPWPKRPHHGISKYALWMLTQVSAVSLAPHIRVNAIVPGPVLKSGMDDDAWRELGEELPLRKTGEPEDVGRAVVYLVSEDFLTGARIAVNGGEHLLYPSHAADS